MGQNKLFQTLLSKIRLSRETPNGRIRYPQKTRVHPPHAELPPDLRYDIGSLGPGNLISASEPRGTNYGADPYAYRRGFCLPSPCERTKFVQNYPRHE